MRGVQVGSSEVTITMKADSRVIFTQEFNFHFLGCGGLSGETLSALAGALLTVTNLFHL